MSCLLVLEGLVRRVCWVLEGEGTPLCLTLEGEGKENLDLICCGSIRLKVTNREWAIPMTRCSLKLVASLRAYVLCIELTAWSLGCARS
jgi:hypothetical protein